MKIFDWIKNKNAADFLDCSRYIDLETPCLIDDEAIITRGGGRMTLISVNGCMNLVGSTASNEFEKMSQSVLSIIKNLFNNQSDVSITWTYEQDPDLTDIEIRESIRPAVNAGKKLGMDVDNIFEELVQGNSKLCMSQDAFIAVWTSQVPQQEYLNGNLVNVETENTPLLRLHDYVFKGAANPFLSDLQTVKKHKSYVNIVLDRLREVDIICEALKSEVAEQTIFRKINKGDHPYTPMKKPKQRGQHHYGTDKSITNPQTGRADTSPFFAPALAEQLARHQIVETQHEGVVKVGNVYYATHTLDVFPKQKISFNRLRRALKGTPFRITFAIKPQPSSMLKDIHSFINDQLGGLGDKNREAYQQVLLMKKMQEDFDCPPLFVQVLLVTWSHSIQDVLRYSALIGNAMVDWGGARVEYDNISPFQTFFSNIPGVNLQSHCLGTMIGADKLIPFLPYNLESSLEAYGAITFRHESGKIIAYNPNSSLQDYDYTLFLARPRQGKSLLMNKKAFVKLMAEGATSMPLITSIDIGPSSEGELQLVRLVLEKRYGKEKANRMVVSQLWDPTKKNWKINPNDIRLGRNVPNKQEMEFIKNFYHSVCADAETGRPINGGQEIINSVIEKVFLTLNTPADEKLFNPAFAPELVAIASEYSIELDRPDPADENERKYKSYYELRDAFFLKGSIEGASLAHRHAMPTVHDYLNMLTTDPTIQNRYNKVYPQACEIIAHKLKTHLREMPHLTKITTLDFSEANVISFDLKPIAEGATDNTSRIRLFTEYMLAMNIGMNKFFINDSILEGMSPLFVKFWKEKINQYSQVDKCLNLDEWHSLTIKSIEGGEEISMPVAGSSYIEWLIKQAPKWRLNINQASHSSSDFTAAMKDLATNVFIYSGTKGKELERITKDFGLTETQVEALKNLHSPDERGSQMLWLYSVKVPHMKGVRGSAKIEYLCCGTMLWGLNTSAKDLPHKLRLEREYGSKPWLKALCEAFPSGSMDKHRSGIIEHLRESNLETDEVAESVEEQLFKRVCRKLAELEYGAESMKDAEAIINSFRM